MLYISITIGNSDVHYISDTPGNSGVNAATTGLHPSVKQPRGTCKAAGPVVWGCETYLLLDSKLHRRLLLHLLSAPACGTPRWQSFLFGKRQASRQQHGGKLVMQQQCSGVKTSARSKLQNSRAQVS